MEHTPIPEQLWGSDVTQVAAVTCCETAPSGGEWTGAVTVEYLPADLDRLFRTAPKLADALRKMVHAHEMHSPSQLCTACQAAYDEARAALAELEE